jgi:uncharacterized protein
MMTINPETVGYLAESVMWLQSEGVKYLIASLNYAGPWTDKTLAQLRSQLLELAEWHKENYCSGRKFYFSPFDKRIASHIFPGRGYRADAACVRSL